MKHPSGGRLSYPRTPENGRGGEIYVQSIQHLRFVLGRGPGNVTDPAHEPKTYTIRLRPMSGLVSTLRGT